MLSERNPFRPGVGLQPPFLAGRQAEQDRFQRVLRSAPEIPGNVRLSGLRGVGKTVLLKRFQEIAERENWATINLELQPRQNDESQLVSALEAQAGLLERRLSLAERARQSAATIFGVARRAVRTSYEGFEWSLAGDLEPRSRVIGEILIAAVGTAQEHHREGLVLMLDEAQILTDDRPASGNHALSTLVAAIATLQKAEIALCVVLCGLPTLAVNLLSARTYTERMFQGFVVDSLGPAEAEEAFIEPLHESSLATSDALVRLVMADVDGYPYFIQLWGAELWDATRDAGLEEIVVEILEDTRRRIFERLDLDFYDPRVSSLTPAEQDLLFDTERCPTYPPIVVAELNARSAKSAGNVNVLLGRLVTANVLYRLRKGQYDYTAPGFRDYLRRRRAS